MVVQVLALGVKDAINLMTLALSMQLGDVFSSAFIPIVWCKYNSALKVVKKAYFLSFSVIDLYLSWMMLSLMSYIHEGNVEYVAPDLIPSENLRRENKWAQAIDRNWSTLRKGELPNQREATNTHSTL